jgi:hypothetical protein
MSYVISHICENIPPQLLTAAFEPTKYNTTIEQRIISQIIEGPILLDTNLVGGKRRDIFLNSNWELDLDVAEQYNLVGTGVQGSYYLIPPEAREFRNISSVIGIVNSLVSSMPGSSINYNGTGSFGNTASGMMSQMINTRTFGQYPITPQVTLEGTNIIRMYPRQMINGAAVSVMLEFDSEFLNMNQSGIKALRELCLCATQRYIANKLRIPVDQTEVVAGMEIGVIKDIINEYLQKAENYDALLMKLKGALHFDMRTLGMLIRHAI